jgi:hypothetical protein
LAARQLLGQNAIEAQDSNANPEESLANWFLRHLRWFPTTAITPLSLEQGDAFFGAKPASYRNEVLPEFVMSLRMSNKRCEMIET